MRIEKHPERIPAACFHVERIQVEVFQDSDLPQQRQDWRIYPIVADFDGMNASVLNIVVVVAVFVAAVVDVVGMKMAWAVKMRAFAPTVLEGTFCWPWADA